MATGIHVVSPSRWAVRWWHSRAGAKLLGELAVLALMLLAYKEIRSLVAAETPLAFANADQVLRLERWLHIGNEAALQQLVLPHELLVKALNRYYVNAHLLTAIAFVVWAYVRHGDGYAHVRRVAVGSTAIALVIHVLYPLAPPRMLPGFVDTMAVWGPNSYGSRGLGPVANQFAAMPSVHFAWAVLIAYGIVRLSTGRYRWLAVAHPVLTLVAIVLTANHYWLDAVVAGVILAFTFVVEAWVVNLTHARQRVGVYT